MNRIVLALLASLLMLLPAASARADSWAPREHLIRASEDGRWVLAVVGRVWTLAERTAAEPWVPPRRLETDRISVVIDGRPRQVRAPRIDGADRVVAQGVLDSEPLDAHVLAEGAGVVFFDTYAGLGSAAVLTRVDGDGATLFAWTLADLFEPHVVASFTRSVSSIHWSRGWWVDEQAGVVGLAYGGNALGLAGLAGSGPRGWRGLPLSGGPAADLSSEALARHARSGPPPTALEALMEVIDDDGPTLDGFLGELLADDTAHLRVRLRAEAALRRRGVDPRIQLIASTVVETARPPALPEDPREAYRLRASREAVRVEAIALLGIARGAKALPTLRRLIGGTPTEARAAAEAVASLGELPGQTHTLRKLLDDPNESAPLRGAAARGLGRTGDPGHLGTLVARLQRGDPDLLLALVAGASMLPGGLDAVADWAGDRAERGAVVGAALELSSDPAAVPLLDALARNGALRSVKALEALETKGEPGVRALIALLQDNVGSPTPLIEWLARAPRPEAASALLAAVDRVAPGAPPDQLLGAALRGCLGDEGLAPILERLTRGHPADGTLVATLPLPHGGVPDDLADAVVAAIGRHIDPEDPALAVLAQAGLQTRRSDAAALLAPLLASPLPPRTVTSIVMLLAHTPEVEATGPLLTAMDATRHDRFTCGQVARALGVRTIDPATEERLLRLIAADGAVCVAPVAKASPRPRLIGALSEWLAAHPLEDTHYPIVEALAGSGDPSAVAGLEAALQAPHSSPARSAAKALIGLGTPGIEALGRALQAGTPADLQPLAALNESKQPLPASVADGVRAALARADAQDDRDAVRIERMALLVLGKVDGDVVPLLIERLESGAGPTGDIARQLRPLADARAAEALLGALDTVEGKDRNAILAALAQTPDVPRVLPLLLRELITTSPGSRDESFLVGLLRSAVPSEERPVGDRSRTSRAQAWRDFAASELGP